MSDPDQLAPPSSEPTPPTEETSETSIYPPHYTFPPFFTLQPNLSTRAHQLSLWSTLLTTYLRHHKIFRLKIPSDLSKPPFSNPAINRSLRLEDAKTVLFEGLKEAGVVVEKVGGMEIGVGTGGVVQRLVGGTKKEEEVREMEVVVWWKRREEWAAEVLRWVEESGLRGDIVAIWDLIHGDVAYFTEFHGMDIYVLRKAIETLEKRGKCKTVMKGEGEEWASVKFY
ncbi:ESCRT-II complex, vps25 subunit [Ascobolus immersus RN42]|uniref:ESCRT-II complex, vps25 subunit n=1 Tax=Ascobolus immersus RN42 TaxID=1160509 RepID=A0A3N4IC70_ASCIM|nr:ESCRT-II complex, vps25 subunit [Ascobolus immersus RN42]